MMVRDLDLLQPGVADGRRLEVVADGLPLFGGAQLAMDAALVLREDGTARRRAAQVDGVALGGARRRKEQVYTELLGHHHRARLVVLAVEVGGKWSYEMSSFVSQLARGQGKERDNPDAQTCRAGLASQVGFHLVLRGDQNSGFVDAGVAGRSGG